LWTRRISLYEESKQRTDAMAQHRELNALKKTEFPWMYGVSKCAPQEALRNLDNAFRWREVAPVEMGVQAVSKSPSRKQEPLGYLSMKGERCVP